MPSAQDWFAGLLIISGLMGLVTVAEMAKRVLALQAESTRKFVHISGGLVCLGFPFWLESPIVVAAIAASMAMLFIVTRQLGYLSSLHGVSRPTLGVVYYPLAVLLLFLFAGSEPRIYVSALLVLAVSDTVAALVGKNYGRLRYGSAGREKSIEGSVAFLVTSFLIVQLVLLLWPDGSALPPLACTLTAFSVAVVATGCEAIAGRGTDNLAIPFATCLALTTLGPFSSEPVERRHNSQSTHTRELGTTVVVRSDSRVRFCPLHRPDEFARHSPISPGPVAEKSQRSHDASAIDLVDSDQARLP